MNCFPEIPQQELPLAWPVVTQLFPWLEFLAPPFLVLNHKVHNPNSIQKEEIMK
jgi:hypothetical protein